MTMHKGDDAPAQLGWKGSLLFGCGIGVVVFLIVGLIVFLVGKNAEEAKRARTEKVLHIDLFEQVSQRGAPPADGAGADWTGQRALGLKESLVDGWGNPIHYRCPGPVHKKGWDLWSCGPNGKDDQGTFDDVLVGDDMAPVSSR